MAKSEPAKKSDGSKQANAKEKSAPAGGEAKLPAKTSKRPYSIIVWGATGFTGSLVCRQIAERYPVRSCAFDRSWSAMLAYGPSRSLAAAVGSFVASHRDMKLLLVASAGVCTGA